MAIFGHSKFGRNLKCPFQIFYDNFSAHITLIEFNGLESNEICTFFNFKKFFEKKFSHKILFGKKNPLKIQTKKFFENFPKLQSLEIFQSSCNEQ